MAKIGLNMEVVLLPVHPHWRSPFFVNDIFNCFLSISPQISQNSTLLFHIVFICFFFSTPHSLYCSMSSADSTAADSKVSTEMPADLKACMFALFADKRACLTILTYHIQSYPPYMYTLVSLCVLTTHRSFASLFPQHRQRFIHALHTLSLIRHTSYHSSLCTTHTDLELALELANTAGGTIMSVFYDKNKGLSTKSTSVDVVTETDKKCEEAIIGSIKAKYPTHKFIAEESHTGSDYDWTDEPTWIIDPIDGTTNFVHAFPWVCVSIGLVCCICVSVQLYCMVVLRLSLLSSFTPYSK
jgi:Inositol monophosphatase family